MIEIKVETGGYTDLALEKKLGDYLNCSPEQIKQALQHDNQDGHRKRLGEALFDMQFITRDELNNGLLLQRVDRLQSCLLFSKVSKEELNSLGQSFEEVMLSKGEEFITQNTTDPYVYILTAGCLEVFRVNEYGDESVLGEVVPGESVGEMGFFTDGIRSASVRATENSNLLRAKYIELTHSFDNVSLLAKAIGGVVAERLQQTNIILEESEIRRQQVERSLDHLSEFLDLSETKALGKGIEGLIERVVTTASNLLLAERASLFLIDNISGELWSKVAEGNEIREIRVPKGAGVVGWVAQNQCLVNIKDAYDDERFNQDVDRRTGFRTRTILCGPVWGLDGEIIGVVQVINKRNDRFNEEDERLFRAFAHQASVAVENFHLYNKMLLSHEKMAVMLDISSSLSQTLDMGELIGRIIDKIAHILQCERSSFFVFDNEAGQLWSMQAEGESHREIRFSVKEGLAGFCARNGEIVNVDDVYTDDRFNSDIDKQTGYKTRNVLCVPVRDRQGIIRGVTQGINKTAGSFSDDDIELLQAICSQISVALDNAQLFAESTQMKNYLQNVQQSITNGIITLDPDYRIVTVNQAALEFNPGLIVQQDVRNVFGLKNCNLLALIERAYENQQKLSEYDVDVVMDESDSKTINVSVLPLRDPDDDFQGMLVILDDITQEKRVHTTLTRYMASDIVDRVLNDPEHNVLGGVRSQATVLFSDIRGFTAIAESLSAEQTMGLLNGYFTLMVEEVFQHRGVLDKFIGDALMAVFGIPFRQDDDAVRAVQTALGMRRALAGFNQLRIEQGLIALKIGIGINTDEIISGNLGSDKRMDYTVIGDGVNISSRLEGLNKQYGTEILISGSTEILLPDNFTLRLIDRVAPKGKSQSLDVYEVLGDKTHQLTEVQQHFIRGHECYQARDFVTAMEWFRLGQDSDGPCRVFAGRCEGFVNHAPPDDWDGVWRSVIK